MPNNPMDNSTPTVAKISRLLAVCALGCLFAAPANASLTPLADAATAAATAQSTLTYTPNPANLNNLDHHMVYTWRIDNISLANLTIASASLTFTNIANWDGNPNVLHIHLLDTAKGSGVQSFVDDPTGSSPVLDLTDDFANPRYHNDPNWLVANGTLDLLLANPSFTTTGTTYTINFTPAQIATLIQYINNGHDIAFGLDPDCHYFNDGLKFTINVTPVPEVGSILPVALLLAGVIGFEIRRRRRVTA
jgi:hypothetical protein